MKSLKKLTGTVADTGVLDDRNSQSPPKAEEPAPEKSERERKDANEFNIPKTVGAIAGVLTVAIALGALLRRV